MRLATTASIAVLALSSAALAQVSGTRHHHMGNNMTMMNGMSGPDNSATTMPMNDTMDTGDNMMSNSASPPPGEPK